MPGLIARCLRLGAAAAVLVSFLATPVLAKDPRRVPKRLTSLGDSITEAINAEEFHPHKGLTRNRWASWVNGYVGDWNALLGRSDVNSHNQRITAQFGEEKRKNKMAARTGAESDDLLKQAGKAVKQKADYVTVLMGQNDVCGDDFTDIPTDAEFEANVRAGFEVLRTGLPPGATIYTLAIVDIHRLWQIGDQLDAFGIIECHDLWEILRSEDIPCATMLDPDLEEADRQFTRSRIVAFNEILERVAAEYEAADPQHYWPYTDVSFTLPWDEDHVSPFDCFHPSARGQELLSEATWEAGPFVSP